MPVHRRSTGRCYDSRQMPYFSTVAVCMQLYVFGHIFALTKIQNFSEFCKFSENNLSKKCIFLRHIYQTSAPCGTQVPHYGCATRMTRRSGCRSSGEVVYCCRTGSSGTDRRKPKSSVTAEAWLRTRRLRCMERTERSRFLRED